MTIINVHSLLFLVPPDYPIPQRRIRDENTFVQYVAENAPHSSTDNNRQQPCLANLSPPPGTTQTTHSPALPEGSTLSAAANTSAEQNQLEPNEFDNRPTIASRKELNQQPRGVPSSSSVATTTTKIINIVASSASPTAALNSAPQPPTNDECIVCNEPSALVRFEPCGHQISCAECAVRMKKCLSCGVPIARRLSQGGHDRSGATASASQPTEAYLKQLQDKILEIEETHCCSICMERRRNVAFLCGHSACSKCAETLKTCHMCRKSIVKKINLY